MINMEAVLATLSNILVDDTNFSALVLFLVLLLLTYIVTTYSVTDVPGPFAFPFIGNLLNISLVKEERRHLYYRNLHNKYGDIYRLYFGRNLVIFLNNYDLINEAFVKQSDIFTHRPDFLPGRTGGIIWSSGEVWKGLRRFSLQTMRDFGVGKKSLEEVIQQEVSGVLEQFKLTNGQGFSPKNVLSTAVSNVIHSIAFGFRYGHDDEHFQQVLNLFHKLLATGPLSLSNFYPLLLFFQVRGRLKRREKLMDYIRTQIEEHQKSYDRDNIRDFVDLYIKQEKEQTMDKDIFTKANLFRVILELFAAGTETTTTTLLWALLFMIEYPDIQKKCQDEINRVIGTSRMINLADRNSLSYVNATILEVQRLSSVVPLGVPHMTTQDCSIKGYHIPKNTIIIAQQTTVHMDPRNWSQPEVFRPERFINETGHLMKSDKLIPFSIGPRVCMGESLARTELFLFFSNFLQKFNFTKERLGDELNLDGYSGVTNSPFPYKLRALAR